MVCCCCCLTVLALIPIFWYLNRWYRRRLISDVSSKYVLVTGTDSGFGYKLAVDLDKAGVHVYAGCFTDQGSQKLKKETSDRLKTFKLDVTNQKSVEDAGKFIRKDLPAGKHLWGLVNNAGIFGNVSFGLSSVDDYSQLLDVNFYGPIRMVQEFEPLIRKSKGRIVNVASIFGRGAVGVYPYCCSKFAIEPYTDGLRRFLSPAGVKVMTIEPGFFHATGLIAENVWEPLLRKRWNELPESRKQELGSDFLDKEIKTNRTGIEQWPAHNYNVPSMVTDAMFSALLAKNPKIRYQCGYEAKIFVILTTILPDCLLDRLLKL